MSRAALWALLLTACSNDPTDVRPLTPNEPTPPPKDSGAPPADAGSAPVDAATGGAATTYIGTLSETPTTQFGGGPNHCTYDVALKNVSIEVDATPDGEVIGGKVTDLMVETVVGTCAFAPQADSQQAFSFVNVTNSELTWAGAAENRPKTGLTVTVTKMGASYQAAATWTRLDESDDLQWVVKTQITLGPR